MGADLAPACANEFEKDDFHNKKDSTNALESSEQSYTKSPINTLTNTLANVPDSTKEHTSYKAPTDYKCHIFGQNLSHITAIIDKFTNQTEIAMNAAWEKMPFDFEKRALEIPPRPHNLDLLVRIALALAKPLSYVRVDLYAPESATSNTRESRIIVGELTFTPTGGTEVFSPSEWDKKLGDMWKHKNSSPRI